MTLVSTISLSKLFTKDEKQLKALALIVELAAVVIIAFLKNKLNETHFVF